MVGKRQIRPSTLSKLTTGNAFRLQWYQNHSNFHCYQQIQSFLITMYVAEFLAMSKGRYDYVGAAISNKSELPFENNDTSLLTLIASPT
jgi:hypothetical protein